MGSIRLVDNIALPTVASTTTIQLASSRISVGAFQYVNLVTLTLNAATTGANGLDTGALAANTLYYIHAVVSNGALAILGSLSKTAPTGFTSFKWTGRGFVTNGSSQIVQIVDSTTWSPIAYTVTTIGGGGTLVSPFFHWWREGNFVNILGKVTLGTVSGTTFTFPLPTNLLIDSTYAVSALNIMGAVERLNGTTAYASTDIFLFYHSASNAVLYAGDRPSGSTAMEQAGANNFSATGDSLLIRAKVPVVGWTNIL